MNTLDEEKSSKMPFWMLELVELFAIPANQFKMAYFVSFMINQSIVHRNLRLIVTIII